MPELPDVEGYRRHLAPALTGRLVNSVIVSDSGVLRNVTPRVLRNRLVGQTFATPRRIGKWLILPTAGPSLLVHSGMTGRPEVVTARASLERFTRVQIGLDHGELRYYDMRKLRGLWLAMDSVDVDRIIGATGPDALHLDLTSFRARLEGRRGAIKPILMDQSIIAGLGNMLTDEICWRAQIHPRHKVNDLSAKDTRRLHTAMKQILRTSVRRGCIPPLRGWLTRVRDDRAPVCPRCRSRLTRSRIGGRTSLWCPRDQQR